MKFAIGFGPFHFSWIVLGFEVLVAFGAAKLEDFAVVSHEVHAMAWVDRRRAKETLLDPHLLALNLNDYKIPQRSLH